MATTVAVLEAILRADTRQFKKDLDKAEGKMDHFGKAAKLGAVAAGAGIAYGLGKVAKIGWDEFNSGQKEAAQTNAVLKSTGGVAKVTAKQVQSLATQIMRKTGIDDEAIVAGENLLLTFTGIRNEAGKNNKIFDQATRLTTDLSTAMGQDMKTSAIQVGKALNDPFRGYTRLQRIGVSFDKTQVKQIKQFEKSGNVMGAQKVILKELQKEFGGSAEAAGKTFGGQMNILRERFNNWAGDMVGKAIPILKRLYEWFNDKVAPVIKNIAQEIFPILKDAIRSIGDTIKENEPQLREIWENVQLAVKNMWKVAGPIIRFFFREVVPRAITIAVRYVGTYIRIIRKIITTARDVVNWFRNSFLPGVRRVWDAVSDRVRTVANFIRDRFQARLERIRDVFHLVKNTAIVVWDFIRGKIQLVVDKVQAAINKLQKFIDKLRHLWDRARGWLGDIGGWFGNLAPSIPTNIRGGFGGGMVGPGSLGAVTTLAGRAGLSITSGYRPGDPGWHGQNRARDYAGSASQMVAFARMVAHLFGGSLLELIHTPLGYGIKNGRRVSNSFFGSAVMADHYDHVHVAMNRGGVVPGRRGAPVPVLAHGGETFIPTHRGGSWGSTVYNFNGPVLNGEGLLRYIEQQSKVSGRRGGPRLNFGT